MRLNLKFVFFCIVGVLCFWGSLWVYKEVQNSQMFLSKKEIKISEQYLNHGYVIQNIDDIKSLDWIRNHFCKIIYTTLPKLKKNKPNNILNNIHKNIDISDLNKFRLNIISKINSINNFRENFYKISKSKKKFRKIDLCLEKKINNFNRQALHAKSLGFVHPKTKREIFFEAKRPKDFDSLIKNLKKASI